MDLNATPLWYKAYFRYFPALCVSLPLSRERNIPFLWSTNVDPLIKLDTTAISIPMDNETPLGWESTSITVADVSVLIGPVEWQQFSSETANY